LSGEAADGTPALTLERVLAAPTWAEDQLHGSLTLRALRWLALLEMDEGTPPQPGKRVVSLETQVDMFKVISDWLKTSKKTKSGGENEEEAPGIEQMREVIRQELEKLEKDAPPPVEDEEDEEEEDELGDEDTFTSAIEAGKERRTALGYSRGKKSPKTLVLARQKQDSGELDIMLNRARKAAHEED
jgi:hypothetical protein